MIELLDDRISCGCLVTILYGMAGMLGLVERSTLPQSQKKVNCPSCRRRTNANEVAYVVNAYEKEVHDPAIAKLQGGEKEDVDFASSVKGSYGTKV